MFERYPQHHEDIVLDGHRSFKQVTLQMHEQWKPFKDTLQEVFFSYIDKYMKDCDITERMFPQKFAFENFRMKRYMPNDVDEFDNHVDVGSIDSAPRLAEDSFAPSVWPACSALWSGPPSQSTHRQLDCSQVFAQSTPRLF